MDIISWPQQLAVSHDNSCHLHNQYYQQLLDKRERFKNLNLNESSYKFHYNINNIPPPNSNH
ncbi:hypothetical protein DOY81_000400 [Sarcophaga bullata]|nr:hypothetical protein DOY81_000400 [Sarcophaga bullata]